MTDFVPIHRDRSPHIRTNTQAASHRFVARHSTKPLTQRRFKRFFLRSKKRLVRYGLLTANIALLGVVVFFVTKSPVGSQTPHQNAVASTTDSQVPAGPLDQVSSADIAVHIARTIGLPEANSVVNHADSVSASETSVPADTSVVAKPQVISAALPSRQDIHTYTVVAGDTVSSIATKFGVSSDSIRGSNGLSNAANTIVVGKQIVLPPTGTNGIVYTVKAGDTPDTLAQKFNANKDAIIAFNDAEIGGLKPGEQILIPDGVVQAPASSYSYYSTGFAWGGSSPIYSSNGYDYGWCTWYTANRRAELGHPVPSNLGNAYSWYALAQRAGMGTGLSPAVGAVMVDVRGNHVAVVEQVNDNGSFWVSEMNDYGQVSITNPAPAGGWGRIDYRLVPSVGNLKFIY